MLHVHRARVLCRKLTTANGAGKRAGRNDCFFHAFVRQFSLCLTFLHLADKALAAFVLDYLLKAVSIADSLGGKR